MQVINVRTAQDDAGVLDYERTSVGLAIADSLSNPAQRYHVGARADQRLSLLDRSGFPRIIEAYKPCQL